MADLIDPFDDTGSEQPDAYVEPVMINNAGMTDPFDEPVVPRETMPQHELLQPAVPTTGGRSMEDIVASKTDPETWEKIKEVFTGAGRETRATEEFPELLGETSGLLADVPMGRVAKFIPALMITLDPEEQADIIQANVPHISKQYDPAGNIVLYNENLDQSAVVNKPGWTMQDTLQSLGLAAEFWTPAKAGAGAKSLLGAMTRTGAATGGVEAVNQALQAAAGGRFDLGEVGRVAAGGAAFEGIGIMLAKAFMPLWRESRKVTPEIRDAFKQSAEDVGIDPEQMTDDFIKSWLNDADRATQGLPEGEFGIRYTKGQREGDLAQLAREERLARGPSGKARERMEQFRGEAGGDIMAARQRITERMGEGPPIERPVEAGERVIEGVGRRAEVAKRAIDEAYGEVGQASLKREGQKGLVTRLQRRAKVDEFDVNAETAPMTARTMGELREMQQFIEDVGTRVPAQSLKHVERWRRRLNKRIGGAQGEDLRQMTILKREFDDYLRKAIDRSLFTGDEQALAQLREASDLYAAYRQAFTRQDTRITGAKVKDTAGELIQKMVEYDDLMPEEVVNYLFGTAKLGRKKDAARAVAKIRNIVGRDSPEFGSLRQAAFLRLTDPGKNEVFSGAKMLTNLTDAMDNSPTLMNSLFSKPEQAMMMRFARAVKKAQPDPQFPSKTPHGNAGYIADAWNKIMTMVGFSQGGIGGAMAARAAAEVTKEVGNMRAGMQARAATSQMRPMERVRLSVLAATEPGRAITEEVGEQAGEFFDQAFEDELRAAP